MFKPVPSAEQASISENDDKFSLRIFTPFSSNGLALWRACRTLSLEQEPYYRGSNHGSQGRHEDDF